MGLCVQEAAQIAIKAPVENEGEHITDEALDEIVRRTEGYPLLFTGMGVSGVLEYCRNVAHHFWSMSGKRLSCLRRLDEGFFRVRFERPKNVSMLTLWRRWGGRLTGLRILRRGWARSSVLFHLVRATIIRKGMIYSPSYGDIAFTVPMFEEYLKRVQERGQI